MTYTELENIVRNSVSAKRFNHCSLTALQTKALMSRFCPQLDKNVPMIGGIWHDIARSWSDEKLLDFALKNGVEIEKEEYEEPMLLHGAVAAVLLEEKTKKSNPKLQAAIRWHTLGSTDMGPLGAALYVADYLEPSRKHIKPFDRLAILQKESLEKMVYLVIVQHEIYLRAVGKKIASTTKKLKEFLEGGGSFN